jgi:hypothetical protein
MKVHAEFVTDFELVPWFLGWRGIYPGVAFVFNRLDRPCGVKLR